MKIIDITHQQINKELDSFILRLDEKYKYENTLIVSIANGGNYIASYVANKLHSEYIKVLCQRNGTHFKKIHSINYFIRKLPVSILNILRILESIYLQLNLKRRRNQNIALSHADTNKLLNTNIHNVLIVDDSVDSGNSMLDVLNYIKKTRSDVSVLTYAFLLAYKKRLITPDYYSFENKLYRFPWSLDKKND